MCVTFFFWDCLPNHVLLIAFNRDEKLSRPTVPAHVWDGGEAGIFGGRDQLGGGTWCAASTEGKAAWLTSFRQKAAPSAGRPSRGLLPAAYLASGSAELPAEFLNGVDAQAFEGFNLLLVDLVRRSCAYLSNGRGERVCAGVDPGLHGLANGLLDAPDFAKVQHGKRQLVALQRSGAFDGDDLPWEELFGIMSQPEVLASEAGPLPATGYDAAFESLVSGVFIPPTHLPALGDDSWYGTRSQTLLAIGRDGRAQCRERYLDWRGPQEAEWREVDLDLRVAVQ